MLQSTLKTQTEDHSGKWKTSSPAKAELPSSYSPRRLVQADLVCGVKLRLLYFNYNGFLKDIFTYICHHHKLLIFLTHHLHPPPSAPFPSWWFFLPLNSPPLLSSHTICVYVSVRPSLEAFGDQMTTFKGTQFSPFTMGPRAGSKGLSLLSCAGLFNAHL